MINILIPQTSPMILELSSFWQNCSQATRFQSCAGDRHWLETVTGDSANMGQSTMHMAAATHSGKLLCDVSLKWNRKHKQKPQFNKLKQSKCYVTVYISVNVKCKMCVWYCIFIVSEWIDHRISAKMLTQQSSFLSIIGLFIFTLG